MQDLKNILEEDELHMMFILLKDVTLNVRIGNTLGRTIVTKIGVPQGDCLSPILFTLYLAKALKEEHRSNGDHNYAKPYTERPYPAHLQDHNYTDLPDEYVYIEQQYADDISFITSQKHVVENIKRAIPKKLIGRNLEINETKTEEIIIKRGVDEWRKCKYLGSHPDTMEDIKRRKCMAMTAFNTYQEILTSKMDIKTKMRIFEAYITSVFMYNSGLWTVNK